MPPEVWQKEWVVHCQPVGQGLTTLKYLAPYIFRVAISNNRILKLANGQVTFRYRATDTGKLKTSTLPVQEFIRRFLQHVLPKGFVKVRYYGFLASGCRKRLAVLRQLLGGFPCIPPSALDSDDTVTSDVATPNYIPLCPSCGRQMRRRSIIHPGGITPRGRCPPRYSRPVAQ